MRVKTFTLVTTSMILVIVGVSLFALPAMGGSTSFEGDSLLFNLGSRNAWRIEAPDDHDQLWLVPYVNGSWAYTQRGAVFWPSGDLTIRGSLSQGSSRELKENITSLSSQEAIDVLGALNPVKYNYIADDSQTMNAGFIAEEVPELISADESKAVKTMDVIAVLTKVVKQQQAELETLQGEVKLLRQNNNSDPV